MSSRADQGPAGSDPHDALDNLTTAEKLFLAGCLPTEDELMIGWAMPVLAAPEAERVTLVAAQIAVLKGLYEDPAGWCARALMLAHNARGDQDG